MRQVPLPFDELRPGGADSLIVTDANAAAFAALGNHAVWPGHCSILTGPARSGKSLMARYFESLGGQSLDDADGKTEEQLFHAWNAAKQSGCALLLLSRKMPADWAIDLPDLKSRLATAQLLKIGPPDDELLEQLLVKHLHDRGTSIGAEVAAYVLKRLERSHSAVETFARQANARALAEGGAISLALVRSLFV